MMMILKYIKYPIKLVLVGALLNGCMQSDYTKLVKAELAKGVREDSILFGIKLGDTRNDFYGKCFDLNKQKLVSQGPGNSSVMHIFYDSTVHDTPAQLRLLFFPSFDKDTITDMTMELSYMAWAPWNPQYQSDSLKNKAMDLLMHWYGGNEFVIAHVNDKDVPVKVDGNRRILVYIKDTQSVVLKIQDLLHPKFRHESIETKPSDGK